MKRYGLFLTLATTVIFLSQLFWQSSLIASSQSEPPAFVSMSQYRSPSNRHKIEVNDEALAQEMVAGGKRLVADYGSFQVFEVDTTDLQALKESQQIVIRDDYNLILLNAGPIDTTSEQALALRQQEGSFNGSRLCLVQFASPIQPPWFDAMLKTGVAVVAYIPNNAYLIYANAASLQRLDADAATNGFIQWRGSYLDDYKLHPDVSATVAGGKNAQSATDLFAIQLVSDPAANAVTLQVVDQFKLEAVKSRFDIMNYKNIIVRIDPEGIKAIAARPDVVSIRPYIIPTKSDERQDQIIAGNLSGNSPVASNYLSWLAGKGFTQSQFTASDFSVDVSDSGIDNGTKSPNHFGLYVNGIRPGTGRVLYNRLEGTPNAGSTIKGCDGHGTINAHIVAGYVPQAFGSGFPHTDSSGFRYGLGVCPFVKLGSSVIFDPDDFTHPDFEGLQRRAYNNGARISTNSWGASVFGEYDIRSQAYDSLTRDAKQCSTCTSGNQEMVIVFAAGNDGASSQTIGSPATAKNVITVGAAENVHAFGGADKNCGITDSGADSANDIIGFSSRGPCADGRKKPDIMAPGTHVTGGVIQVNSPPPNGQADPCFDGSAVCGGVGSNFFPASQQWYTASSGTSHSTPAVAGAAALVRQFFINTGSIAPSPAMTKAYLMNSARYMTGSGANDTLWSNNQGMGEVNLGFAFDGVARTLKDQVPSDMFTATGQTRTVTGSISDSTKPFRVTLAWTDAPGSTTGNAYNNNLDLTVTVNGNTYRGNVFSGATSVTGGAADAKNNVESVFLPAGVSGSFTITVTAANINSDGVPNVGGSLDQDYALVVYNTGNPPPSVSITSPTSGASFTAPANITINADANDSDGTISKVEFYQNGFLLSTDASAPYSFSWSNVAAGNYSLTAKAYDNLNASTTSTPVNITVTSGPLQSPFLGVPFAVPGTIQLEDFDNGGEGIAYHDNTPGNDWGGYRSTGVDIYGIIGDSGGGYAIANAYAGEWLEYTVNIASAGTYNIEVRVASDGPGGTIHVEFDGVNKTGTMVVLSTGGWDTWQSIIKSGVSLSAGQQVMRLSLDTNGSQAFPAIANLSYIRITNANQPPTVSITSPANGASFLPSTTITIKANASDSDGTISKVEFYQNGFLLGTDISVPYSFSWSNVAAGNYSLTAKAYDNLNASTTSTPVNIIVTGGPPNQFPTVSITSPANGTSFTAPANIAINASASDSDGTISKVEFYQNGILLNTDVSAPYNFTWSNVAAGNYSLTAKAYDNLNASTTSTPVNITVTAGSTNQPPTVSITSPNDGAIFWNGLVNIQIFAVASDSDGISKVEFYQNGFLLGTDTTALYDFFWSNVTAGTYSLTARAYDNLNASTTSIPVNITVSSNQTPSVSITSPLEGESFTAPANIAFNVSASDSDGTISKVEFYQNSFLLGTDTTAPYSFLWNNVAAGSYSLTARAYDNGGASVGSFFVNITVIGGQAISVSITSPPNGESYAVAANVPISSSDLAYTDNNWGGHRAIGVYMADQINHDDGDYKRGAPRESTSQPERSRWRCPAMR